MLLNTRKELLGEEATNWSVVFNELLHCIIVLKEMISDFKECIGYIGYIGYNREDVASLN